MIEITLQIAMPLDILEDYRKYTLEELEVDPHLSGYFKLETDDFIFGFTQNKPIENDEQGWAIPVMWLEHLLIVSRDLKIKKYVAVADTETSGTYLEFTLEKTDEIQITEIYAESSQWVLYDRPCNSEIKRTSKTSVDLKEFRDAIEAARTSFLRDLYKINPFFREIKEIKKISSFV